VSTVVRPLAGRQAFVFADIYTRDAGGGSACNRFVGTVRVIQRGRVWRYQPGAAGDTFDRRTVPRSNRNCRRLFS